MLLGMFILSRPWAKFYEEADIRFRCHRVCLHALNKYSVNCRGGQYYRLLMGTFALKRYPTMLSSPLCSRILFYAITPSLANGGQPGSFIMTRDGFGQPMFIFPSQHSHGVSDDGHVLVYGALLAVAVRICPIMGQAEWHAASWCLEYW